MYQKFITSLSTLAILAAAGCASAPGDLDLSLAHPSVEKKFIVAMQPPNQPAALNQMHAWQIKLTTPSGQPVSNARFRVDGGMLQHGHGLPSQPQVTKEIAAGTYLLEGVKFSMTGWWEIKLAIDTPAVSDKVTFNTVVNAPVVVR